MYKENLGIKGRSQQKITVLFGNFSQVKNFWKGKNIFKYSANQGNTILISIDEESVPAGWRLASRCWQIACDQVNLWSVPHLIVTNMWSDEPHCT